MLKKKKEMNDHYEKRRERACRGKSVSVVPSADVREPALVLVVAVY